MLVLNDIWVNWFEGEDKGYNVCPFFEWRKRDKIELVDMIPVLYIDNNLYHYIENGLDDLPKKLLAMIQNRMIVKGSPVEYGAVVTDGEGVIVFDTMGYQIPFKKSRLIPRHERRVIQMIQQKTPVSFPLEKTLRTETEHLFSLAPEAMLGLNRRERELKQLMMLVLDQMREGKNIDELHYWLTEWEPDHYQVIQKLSFRLAWKRLYNHIYQGWSSQHEQFCWQIVKGQPLFEQLWARANQVDIDSQVKRIK